MFNFEYEAVRLFEDIRGHIKTDWDGCIEMIKIELMLAYTNGQMDGAAEFKDKLLANELIEERK